MSSFTITTPSATVNLSPSSVKGRETAKGTATYSVTNKTGATVRTALRVKPGGGTQEGWFTVRNGEERDIGPGKTEDFSIDLSVAGAAARPETPADQRPKLSFHAVAVNLKDPNNDTEAGSAVAFSAPALTRDETVFKWWMVAVPIALVLVAVGGFFGIKALLEPAGPVLADWTTKPVDEARAALQAQKAQVTERHPSDLGPATVAAQRFYQRIVQSQNPVADGKLTVGPGSIVELVWEWQPTKVVVPEVGGQTAQQAIDAFENAGVRFIALVPPTQPEPPKGYQAVRDWQPRGSVDAGTGITLTMEWKTRGLIHFGQDVVILQDLKVSPEFLRRGGLEPQ